MNKFIKLIYPFFILIAFVYPRKKDIWVFGNQKGYIDNTRYFFEYISRNYEQYECYWLANNKYECSTISQKGLKSVPKHSFNGYWLSARANFSFICNGFSDVNRLLALNGKVISFWHGTPIKKIYLDSQYDLKKFGGHPFAIKISGLILKFLNQHIDFYYASNKFEQTIVTRAAAICASKSVALGVPRFDEIRNAKRHKNLPDGRLILYAPTWREDRFQTSNFAISKKEYENLCSFLDLTNTYLIVKPHPLTDPKELICTGLKPSKYILYSDALGIDDISALYIHVNILITDLSSSIFDYLISGNPVILFMPDVKQYMHGDRGIYQEFNDIFNSEVILKSWSELICTLNIQKFHYIELIDDIGSEIKKKTDVCQNIYIDLCRRFIKC